MNYATEIRLKLPLWAGDFAPRGRVYESDANKMSLAISLSKLNIEYETGGPYGAAIFNMDSNELVAIGVNVVVPSKCSLAHAEIMAIMLAQQTLGTFDLSAPSGRMELFTSVQPCVQCWGAMHWSGIRRLVYGATVHDVELLTGFDAWALPQDWEFDLEVAGIGVVHRVLQKEAREVLAQYSGRVYNAS